MNPYDISKMFVFSLGLTIGVEAAVVFLFLYIITNTSSVCKAQEQKGQSQEQKGQSQEQKGQSRKEHKGKELVFLVVLVNLLTNPAAVLLCWLGRLYLPCQAYFPLELAVEIAVVAVEACVYRSFAGQPRWRISRPVLLAVMANLCSWLTGRLI